MQSALIFLKAPCDLTLVSGCAQRERQENSTFLRIEIVAPDDPELSGPADIEYSATASSGRLHDYDPCCDRFLDRSGLIAAGQAGRKGC